MNMQRRYQPRRNSFWTSEADRVFSLGPAQRLTATERRHKVRAMG